MVSTAGVAAAAGAIGAPDAPDVLPRGAKAGPWIIERELGRGGMGAVYAVIHEEIGKRAALKIVHRKLLTPSFNVDRVLLEAKVVNAVGHPNIVDIFETGKLEDGRPYVVMERLEGQPLSFRADDGKILPDQVIDILLQICDALIAAHAANIVHRDLKLDNVFLVDNPDAPSAPRVKLLDWGIAKVINHDVRHTIEGQLVGTPQYLSPEQARGAAVSPQTDVYSLGVMAYELFLEQLPFEAETAAEIMAMHLRATPPPPSELWPDIPVLLETLLLQMLAKNPDNRPTMLEVARRLEQVRSALRRRREELDASGASSSSGPHAVAAVPLESRRSRLISSGLAPTEPAEPAMRPRWQFAAGLIAIAASATLFATTKIGGGSTATAATAAAEASPAAIDPSAPGIAGIATDAVADSVAVHAPSATAAVAVPVEAGRIAPIGLASAAVVSDASGSGAPQASTRPVRRTGAHSSPRKAPAVPRRAAARIDPDGTIDPYE